MAKKSPEFSESRDDSERFMGTGERAFVHVESVNELDRESSLSKGGGHSSCSSFTNWIHRFNATSLTIRLACSFELLDGSKGKAILQVLRSMSG